MSLEEISYDDATMHFENRRRTQSIDLARHLRDAHELFHEATTSAPAACRHPETNADFEQLRWFPYGHDVATAAP
jgi:hypothetical protein